MQNYDNPTCCDKHTNAFLDLNGIPYLLAEYLDTREFRQMDRSMVRSEIFVDQSEAMRAVVDINIDDIGKHGTSLAITGNNTKQKELLQMIQNNAELLDNQLDVIKCGIIIRVNYQLENQTTHQVLRSMVEDLRIDRRSYFMDINPKNVDDNAILVNFASTMVSTINNFTHGVDRMVLRITNIQMFYEGMKRECRRNSGAEHTMGCNRTDAMPINQYADSVDYYQYHEQMQTKQNIGVPGTCNCGEYGNEPVSYISPPSWSMINRFYHFDNSGRDIVVHFQEVNDRMARIFLVPCGVIQVNRAFVINPGHRIIFRISIWKNDLTVVGDTTMIAKTLKAPVPYPPCPPHYPPCPPYYPPYPPCPPPINPDYEEIKRMLEQMRITDSKQNMALHELSKAVKALEEEIHKPVDPEPPIDPDPPVDPEPPIDPDPPVDPNGDTF